MEIYGAIRAKNKSSTEMVSSLAKELFMEKLFSLSHRTSQSLEVVYLKLLLRRYAKLWTKLPW